MAQGRKRDGALGAVTLSEEAVEEAIAAFEDSPRAKGLRKWDCGFRGSVDGFRL